MEDDGLPYNVKPIQCWGSCWTLVTGASEGIGAGICVRLAKEIGNNSVMVGVARNEDGLQKTGEKVKKANDKITFIPYPLDLECATENDYSMMIKAVLEKDVKDFHRFAIVHNAGSLGDLSYLRDLTATEKWNKYFALNITSVMSLSGTIVKFLQDVSNSRPIHVVNISSLCAVKAMKSWGMYCVAKAARDMAMSVLAAEEENVSALSYAPGPIETKMQIQARSSTADPAVRRMYNTMQNEGNLVKMEDSLTKLMYILKLGCYVSGAHIDYFDEDVLL